MSRVFPRKHTLVRTIGALIRASSRSLAVPFTTALGYALTGGTSCAVACCLPVLNTTSNQFARKLIGAEISVLMENLSVELAYNAVSCIRAIFPQLRVISGERLGQKHHAGFGATAGG